MGGASGRAIAACEGQPSGVSNVGSGQQCPLLQRQTGRVTRPVDGCYGRPEAPPIVAGKRPQVGENLLDHSCAGNDPGHCQSPQGAIGDRRASRSQRPLNGFIRAAGDRAQSDDGISNSDREHRRVVEGARELDEPVQCGAKAALREGHHHLILGLPRPWVTNLRPECVHQRRTCRGVGKST